MRVPGTARCMQWRRIPVDCSLNSGVCASPNSENCPHVYPYLCGVALVGGEYPRFALVE